MYGLTIAHLRLGRKKSLETSLWMEGPECLACSTATALMSGASTTKHFRIGCTVRRPESSDITPDGVQECQ
jgi:hypothetical protein